jgi:PAS domain-containing protein
MNTVVVASDVISMFAFAAAAIVGLVGKVESPLVTKPVRYVFVAAMCLYAFVGFSNVLEHAGITAALDIYEDFAEILFVPALAYIASTMVQNYQIDREAKSSRVMRQQNDLLLNIVDTVPGGVLVVDPTGAVTFANEGAERILGMASDTGGSVRLTPSWTLHDPLSGAEVTLGEIASGGPLMRKPLLVQWPDGMSTEFIFSATPMNAKGGELGGSVVAFDAAAKRS